MFAITVNEKGGETRRIEFDKPEVTIGRVQGNDIILPKGNVSKRHSRIVFKDGKFIIVDLKSTNGTYVNGRKITSPLVIKGTDKVYIGDFILSVEDPGQAGDSPELDSGAPPLPPPQRAPLPPPPMEGEPTGMPGVPPDLASPAVATAYDNINVPPPRPTDLVSPQEMGGGVPPPAEGSRPLRPSSGTRSPGLRPPTVMGEGALPRGEAVVPESSAAPPRPPASPRSPSSPSVPLGPAASPGTTLKGTPPAPSVAPTRPTPSAPIVATAPGAAPYVAHLQTVESLFSREERTQISQALAVVAQRLAVRADGGSENPAALERQAQDLLDAHEGPLPARFDRQSAARDLAAELSGRGPLDGLLGDAKVQEILVARHDQIYVEREGRLILSEQFFSSPDALVRAIERSVGGTRHDAGWIDCTFDEGAFRLEAGLPPLAAEPFLLVRRRGGEAPTLAALVAQGVLSQPMVELLLGAIEARRTLLISGGSGSGRSTLLAALERAMRDSERAISLSHTAPLWPNQGYRIRLNTRQGGLPRALDAALRLSPDRLVLDDIRGEDTLVALTATATVPGTVLSTFGLSPADALARLATLAQLAPDAPSLPAVRQAVAATIHVVVQLAPRGASAMRVAEIVEVSPDVEGRAVLHQLSLLRSDGSFVVTGQPASFSASRSAPATRV